MSYFLLGFHHCYIEVISGYHAYFGTRVEGRVDICPVYQWLRNTLGERATKHWNILGNIATAKKTVFTDFRPHIVARVVGRNTQNGCLKVEMVDSKYS